MTPPREIELKLELDPPVRPARLAIDTKLGQGETRHLTSRYFDTAGRDLRARGLALRVRRDGDRRIQTLKASDGGLIGRSEWESEIAGDEPDLAAIPDGDLRDGIAALGALLPVFETDVQRTTWMVARGGSAIEVALDHGRVAANGTSRPIGEIEVELKSGSASDLFDVARDLAEARPVRLGVQTKSERGYGLEHASHRESVKAEEVSLDRHGTAGDAFQVIARGCIRHFRLNEPGILEGRSAASLHQARVAIRRLRSAFGLFRPVIAGPESQRLGQELRTIFKLLGDARNLDVFQARAIEARGKDGESQPGSASAVETRLTEDRERSYDRVIRRLRSQRFRLVVIDLARLVEAGPWLTDPDCAKDRDRPVRAFATRVLSRLRRKVKRAGRRLASLGPEDRHQVRISAKKLRYATEFFASLVRGRKHRRRQGDFLDALEDLQASLGSLNDMETISAMAADLALTAPALGAPENMPGASPDDLRRAYLLASAEEAHRALRRAKRFW